MRLTHVTASAALALVLALAAPGPSDAQARGPFAPRVTVNGAVITQYEYDQRLRFMTLLNAPGDLVKEAEKTLIEDRLRLAAAQRMKIRLTPQQIESGMTEFASRFEMPLEEFVAILTENGVAAETYRDFVQAGLAWREVVRARFGPQAAASIFEPEVDRALSVLTQKGSTRVLLSEILLPASRQVLAQELSQSLRGEGAFAAAARQHSLGPSAQDGGRVDWRNAAALPQAVVAALEGLTPGRVSVPVRLADGRYALYLLRQIVLRDRVTPQNTAIEYAWLVIPGAGTAAGDARLAQVRQRVDRCNDLNAFDGQLTRETVVQTRLAAELAGRLAALAENERAVYTEGGAHMVLMLWSRRIAGEGEPDRDTVRSRLVESRVASQAELYLAQLRSNARISRP